MGPRALLPNSPMSPPWAEPHGDDPTEALAKETPCRLGRDGLHRDMPAACPSHRTANPAHPNNRSSNQDLGPLKDTKRRLRGVGTVTKKNNHHMAQGLSGQTAQGLIGPMAQGLNGTMIQGLKGPLAQCPNGSMAQWFSQNRSREPLPKFNTIFLRF